MTDKPVEALKKGDEVWECRYEMWRGQLDARTALRHGVVTGGGPHQVLVTWDAPGKTERYDRSYRPARTPAEALARAKVSLYQIEQAARERMEAAQRLTVMVEDAQIALREQEDEAQRAHEGRERDEDAKP